jgi:hypothetical protein
MSVIGRVRAVAEVLARHRDEPAVRARAAQVAGGALIADGLIGLENPLGEQSRSGILGGIVLTVIGIVLLGPAAIFGASLGAYPDGETVVGSVSSVGLPEGDGGACSMTFVYDFDGSTYERTPGWTGSGLCDLVVGDPVEVSVLASDPGRGRYVSGGTGVAATWIPRGPWLLIALGGWTTLVRLVELIVGIRLLLWGRRTSRELRGTPVDDAIVAELKRAWAGEAGPLPGPAGPATGTA